ncbi:MAG: glutamine amidotransferase [Sphaerochaetaceae bacterium]|nr:glutamine amidotransferase [Sphaerochaetaceae bacterium]
MEQRKKIEVLLAGESWMSQSTHHKGFDYFSSSTFETGHQYLLDAFEQDGEIVCTHLCAHEVPQKFPKSLDELKQFDVVILSDIGSNSLLLTKEVFLEGKKGVNRLELLKEYVGEGGGFCMAGGYLSFAGFEAKAKYYRTAVEEILPVSIFPFDDRVETPEGCFVVIEDEDHPVLEGIDEFPSYLLGYQEVTLKDDSCLIASTDKGDPLLALRDYGKGRSLAWTSDIGPHWCPHEFASSPAFKRLWQRSVRYLAKRI